jgi:CRISPR/Cas system-associated exonuclease Cas4 (RecB family)
MAQHSIFSPSSSHRWLNCPGSVKLAQQFKEAEPGISAKIGTAAHALADKCFETGLSCFYFIGIEFNGIEVTKAMAEKTQYYVDYVNDLKNNLKDYPAKFMIESRVAMPSIDDRLFGTCDAALITPYYVHVIDFKFGKWQVQAKDNTQLKYYALAIYLSHKAEIDSTAAFLLHIVQPNTKPKDNKAVVSVDELLEFENTLIAAVNLSDMPEPVYKEGEHCRFCPGEVICPELNKLGRKIF